MDGVAASNESSNDSSDIPSHNSPNVSSNDPANDSSYDSSDSPSIPSNVSSNVTANVSSNVTSDVSQNASQLDPQSNAPSRVLSNRRQGLKARLRASWRDAVEERYDPKSSSYPSYDGPNADCAEAMRVTPCCGACFVDSNTPVTAGDKLTERMSVLYGFKDQLRYVGHIDSCSSFYSHCTSHSGCASESPYTIVNGMWCIYHTHPPWRSRPSVKRETWPFDTDPRYSAIAYHQDCYATFIHACPLAPELARERLWLASMARYPGPSHYYYMVARSTVFDMSEVAIREVARAYGLPELARCPTEIVQLIHQHSSSRVFLWRAMMAYTLAVQLALLPKQPLTEMRLVDIVKWKRGDLLVPPHPEHVYSDDDAKSVMRITLDNRGIKEIERASSSSVLFWESC